ncbi:MAG: Flp pilus assembly protein CpaB [Sphingopyxis sp.]|uniref:Flp pilus assembly protein CpaB n=1 Tax=Sphingopyxis sp. TaxID=1908224 RepID=UPI003D811CED
MDTRKIMLIVGALIIAIGAAFGVNQMMRGASAPEARAAAAPDINGPMILVATRQLPVGTIIGPDSFRFQPWPKELVEKAYFMKEKTDVQTLVGTVVRYPITAGQPLTQGALVHPDDRGFLAAALGPGMRAVTVKVSQEQGVAGFVFPGDRVDVVLAQTIDIDTERSSYPDKQLFTAETIVRNVRVLATDQRFDAEDETGKTPVRTFGSVTLEATPEIAERIAVAQSMGKISLALRPLAESSGELEAAIASGEVNVPAKGGTAAERRMMAEAANRPTTAKSATTGGDISRFWIPVSGRVSAPRQAPSSAAISAPSISMAPSGPVVRITRGDKVSEIPVGGN